MIDKVKKINMLILLKYLKVISQNTNNKIRFDCPFHESNSQSSANINNNNNIWCWGCAKAYDVIEIYKKYTDKNFMDSLQDLFNFSNSETYKKMLVENENFTDDSKEKKRTQVNNNFKKNLIIDNKTSIEKFKNHILNNSFLLNKVRDFYKVELYSDSKVLKYLIETRKLNIKTIQDFNLGLTNKNNNQLYIWAKKNKYVDKLLSLDLLKEQKKEPCFIYDSLVDCLVIPIEFKNNTTHFYKNNYYQEITQFNPKYKAIKNINNIPIFYFPYGFSKAWPTIEKTKKMIIHEGFFDVMNCHQNGIKNVVGMITITNYLSHQVINILKKYNIDVIIGLDNDESGNKNSIRISQQLKDNNINVEIKNISLPDCKDADDILKKYNLNTYKKIYM